MALQYLYYAGQGPLQFDDTTAYPDMDPMEASRAPQHYIENEPTLYYHVVRLSGLTSKLTSIASGAADVTARSMATSAAVVGGNAQGTANNAVNAASAALSYATYVNSRLTSHLTP